MFRTVIFVYMKRLKFSFFALLFLVMLPLIVGVNKHQKNTVPVDSSDWATKTLAQLSLEEKIGQFFMIPAYPNQGEAHFADVKTQVQNNKIGGIIWFQGTKDQYLKAAKMMQSASEVPLLYGMDAEWGASMRLSGEERFPYAYTLGAANNQELTKEIGEMMAQECRELGIHLSFGPVADVHSNPKNPVIGFRSFGENPEEVGNHVAAMIHGYDENGVMTSAKHFPGHGDTDTDSHLELPIVNKSRADIEAIDFLPFREAIRNEVPSIMVGHLNVPALDPSGTPSSLSSVIIKDILQNEMGYKGLVISDALNMKAVANKYGKTEVVVKAFQAGCDILLFPESVGDAIAAIKAKVEKGEITQEEIDARCLKVLKAKQKYVVQPKDYKRFTSGEIDWAKKHVFEESTVLLKNLGGIWPIGQIAGPVTHISVGESYSTFSKTLDLFAPIEHANLSFDEVNSGSFKDFKKNQKVVISVHATTVRPKDHFGMPQRLQQLFDQFSENQEVSVVFFGNPLLLNNVYDFSKVDAIVVAYENNGSVQDRVAQMVFGAIPMQGKLPFSINLNLMKGEGIATAWNGRLKFSQPEELGINPAKLLEIDSIVNEGIKQKAFPGCQIVAAAEGKIFFRKSYGTHRYDDHAVVNEDLYDIASITKIAASTLSVMTLQSKDDFSLNAQLKDYIPEVTGDGKYADLYLKEMLAHRSGLKSWIPFYTKTLTNGQLNMDIYSTTKKEGYTTKVEDNLWIMDSYADTMYNRILNTSLGSKKYLYSDLGYYFIKKIIEKKTGMPMDQYLEDSVYLPMGLYNIGYNPYLHYDLKHVVPTEDDKIYRHTLVHGYVHDPGAAMIGGVGGHAGIFSTATDLAAVMQLFMNKGYYAGKQFIKPEVIEEYTKVQYTGNRRGAGFDKPKTEGGGTCDEKASKSSYGHSGFTGTLAWNDPETQLNYVFLSNRVYPDAENWKLVKMGTRTEVQRVLFEALEDAKK